MNLSSLATVVEFSQLYMNEYTKLDLLINNAGMLQQILYLFIKKEIKTVIRTLVNFYEKELWQRLSRKPSMASKVSFK